MNNTQLINAVICGRLTQKQVFYKSSVLGFKALTGSMKSLKAIIQHLRGSGLGGMGGNEFNPQLGRMVRTPIARVRPELEAARLPGTGHLPTGSSHLSQNMQGSTIAVGKGAPRLNIEMNPADNSLLYTQGIRGGTNPSPIASFLHEGGHFLHHNAVSAAAKDPARFGGVDNAVMKGYGWHRLPGVRSEVNTIMDEAGANSAAMQAMRQSGASQNALNYYQAARAPSFSTYAADVKGPLNTAEQGVMDATRAGYTNSGMEKFYKNAFDWSEIGTGLQNAGNATQDTMNNNQ